MSVNVTTLYRVKYRGATDTSPSRHIVHNYRTGKRKHIDIDFTADNPAYAAAVKVHGGPVEYVGEDLYSRYYIGRRDL